MSVEFTLCGNGLDHPEGVVRAPDGSMYAGGEGGQIYHVALDGTTAVIAETGGFVLGLALDAAGRIYVCDLVKAAVLRIDPTNGEIEPYASRGDGRTMTTPNYLAFDDAGTLYVTDSGSWKADDGLVWRVDPDGQASVWSTGVPRFTNGCCLSAARDALYVVESLGPAVARLPIDASGAAGRAETMLELPGTVPDGLALDRDGNLYVGCYRPDRIYRVAPGGRAEILAEDAEGVVLSAPTNIAFVGADHELLVAANLGRYHLSVADIGVAGLPLCLPEVPS